MKAIKVFESRQSLDKIFEKRQICRLRIGETKLCIGKYKSDYFAFALLCPHQQEPLDLAQITSFGEIVCPLHQYRFHISTGNEANAQCQDLKTYPLEINEHGDFIYLH